ncbi:hypothetical protein LJR220_003329 [Bradyrhizobium sp. LjRoot220]|uniref:phage baseplate plug family protein n=1 Tax=Bradyrhizobium sp. LjRoot220 TaxID=3342284 RepID=UPI003ECEA154
MSDTIPLSAVPNQAFVAPVGSQNCRLNIYQKTTGLYMDVILNEQAVILGVLCEDRNRIVRNVYLGFSGDFAFFDTQGTSDPDYTGLGERYRLIYFEESEIPEGVT